MRMAWMAGLALVVFGVSPLSADEWSRRYPVHGRPELHLKAGDASVRVEAAPPSEIGVQVTTEGWRIGDGGVSITETQSGNRVEIEVRRPRGNSAFSLRRHSIAVVVSVPTPADLDVRTGDGSIDVSPLSGNLALRTGDGSITADGLQGEILLQAGDGSIKATGLAGQLEAHTGDGHIDVRGRFDRLDLHSGDGGIETVAEQGSRVESAWSLRSGDGSITLRLPEDLGAELDAHTGDGRIEVERSVTVSGRISDSAVKGKIGAGGPPIQIHTGDGSIHLVGL
jgi:DUF4097 and DUF4098 domain-containing protein YvlB